MELYVFLTGRIRMTGAPVLAYLVRIDNHCVLVDTGYPRERAGAYRDNPRELIEMNAGDDVVSQVARLGIKAADIGYVVCTHFDIDHAGNYDAFPQARFVVQRRHLDWARTEESPRIGQVRAQWDRSAGYQVADGDTTLLPGIELLESSGHVPGHQSVLVRLPGSRPVLLAADAIPTREAQNSDTRPIYPFDMDAEAVRASTRKLTDLARAENARIIYGHDPGIYQEITAFPGRFT
jgi:N-acyl homoserine lactone hydrolase